MIIMTNMTGWLIEYIVYGGTLHVLAIMLPDFWQKYMNVMIIYMITHMKLMHVRMLKVKYEACA